MTFTTNTLLSEAKEIIESHGLSVGNTSSFPSDLIINVEKSGDMLWTCRLRQDIRIQSVEPYLVSTF